jgi:hypothetical protein
MGQAYGSHKGNNIWLETSVERVYWLDKDRLEDNIKMLDWGSHSSDCEEYGLLGCNTL